MSDDFPKIRAAIEFAHVARLAAESAQAASRGNWRLRAQAASARDVHQAAAVALRAAYARELLPSILGGAWHVCRPGQSPVWAGYARGDGGAESVRDFTGALVDHPHTFRRVGSRGRLTWENSVVLAEPYNVWSRDRGAVTDEARAHAARLHARHGLSVWTRADLSGWFMGWTALVLIARGIAPNRAPAFGFTALS